MTSVVIIIIIIIIISLIRQVGRNWMALSVAAHLSVCLSVCLSGTGFQLKNDKRATKITFVITLRYTNVISSLTIFKNSLRSPVLSSTYLCHSSPNSHLTCLQSVDFLHKVQFSSYYRTKRQTLLHFVRVLVLELYPTVSTVLVLLSVTECCCPQDFLLDQKNI